MTCPRSSASCLIQPAALSTVASNAYAGAQKDTMVRQARLMKFLPTITRILSIGGTLFLKSKLKLVTSIY